MTGRRRRASGTGFVRNLMWNYLGTLVTGLSGFAITPFVIRGLGVDAFGAVALLGVMGAYAALADFGIGMSATKMLAECDLPRELRKARGIFSSVLVFYSLAGLLLFVVGMALYPLVARHVAMPASLRPQFHVAFVITLVSVVIAFGGASLSGALHGLGDFKAFNVAGIIGEVVYIVAVVLGAVVLQSIVAMTALMLVANLVHQGYKLRRVLQAGVRFERAALHRGLFRQLATFGSAMFVMNVAARVSLESDSVVIGLLGGTVAVGLYQVAANPSLALRQVSDQLSIVAVTDMAGASSRDDLARVRHVYENSLIYTAVLFAGPTVFAAVYGREFLQSWVGPVFAGSAPSLALLFAAMFVLSVQTIASQVLLATGRHMVLAAIVLVEAAVNLAASILLYGRLGITGVALGTVAPLLVSTVFLVLPLTTRRLGIRLRDSFAVVVRPLLVALLASPILFAARYVLVKPSLLSTVAVAVVFECVFVAVLLALDARVRAFAAPVLARLAPRRPTPGPPDGGEPAYTEDAPPGRTPARHRLAERLAERNVTQ